MTAPACAHERRFYFRTRIKFEGRRPASKVVERCLDCHTNPRGADVSVDRAELEAAGLVVGALQQDPWEGTR